MGGPAWKNEVCLAAADVAGKALKAADLYRCFHEQGIDTSTFAEDFGRTGPGATAAENVGVENRPGRAELVAVQNLPDESWDVDVRWAGPGARGIETEQTARRLNPGLVDRKRRWDVGKLRGQ